MTIQTMVHRVEFPIKTRVIRSLRGYFKPVHVSMHRSRPNMIEVWYECFDIDEWMEVRFWVHGTGAPFAHAQSNCPHVGTVFDHESQPGQILVWHVYAEYPIEERFIQ